MEFDILAGDIPGPCHSPPGRAKQSLAGKPEARDSGELFPPVLDLVSERMPAAIVLESEGR